MAEDEKSTDDGGEDPLNTEETSVSVEQRIHLAGDEAKEAAEERRRKIAVAMKTGNTNRRQLSIALKVSVTTIAKDIKRIHAEWRDERVDDIRMAKAQAMTELDYAKADLWRMLAASKQDYVETRVVTERESATDANPTTKTTVVTRKQTGDPRYMEQIIRIALAQARIMGVDGETKINVTGAGSGIDMFDMVMMMEKDRRKICDANSIDELIRLKLESRVIDAPSEPTNGKERTDDSSNSTKGIET